MQRKRSMEVNLNSYTTWGALLQQGDFDRLKVPDGETPQIYFICRRPKITFDPNTIKREGNKYELDLVFNSHKKPFTQRISIPWDSNDWQIDLSSKHPFTHLKVSNQSGEAVFGSAAILATYAKSLPHEYLDLEVLYIGQSVSESANYGIIDRLKNHSTLQAIYAEAIRNSPDHDIWIALFHFEYQEMYMFNGPALVEGKLIFEDYSEENLTDIDEEIERMGKIRDSADLDQQYINFTEAALIRYFEPEYNQKFRNTFPNPAHSSYASCYELDVHSVSVGLATDAIEAQVYTIKRDPVLVHPINFVLNNSEERRNLFNLLAA